MPIPDDFIEKVLDCSDVVDVVSRRVTLKKAGKDYVACCPFHTEKTPSFTVSPVKQFYHCFGCGAHGTALGFLMQYDGMSFPDAVEALAHQAGLQMPETNRPSAEQQQRREKDNAIYGLLDKARKHFTAALRANPVAIEYAKSRGMTGEIAAHFGLGYAPGGDISGVFPGVTTGALVEAGLLVVDEDSGEVRDKFRRRLMFPIQDEKGRVIGFGGRVIGDGKPKYLNSPESPVFRKGMELYGIMQAKQAIRQSRQAVVLEGYMDVVMLHQHGEHRAVAALGTSLTEDQVRRLYRMADEIIFCFDGDKPGQAAAARAARLVLPELADGKSARFVSLSEDHDPDSFVRAYGLDAWRRAIGEQGKPLSAKLVDILLDGRDPSLPETKAAVAKEAEALLGAIANAPLFRQALTRHFEGVVGMPLQVSSAPHPAPQRQARSAPQRGPSDEDIKPNARAVRGAEDDRVPSPTPGKQQVYTNLATICALDLEAIERVPLELVGDRFSEWIIRWFGTAQELGPEQRIEHLEALSDSALRSYIHIGLQREAVVRRDGEEAVRREVAALLDAFGRVSDRHQKRAGFNSLFE